MQFLWRLRRTKHKIYFIIFKVQYLNQNCMMYFLVVANLIRELQFIIERCSYIVGSDRFSS